MPDEPAQKLLIKCRLLLESQKIVEIGTVFSRLVAAYFGQLSTKDFVTGDPLLSITLKLT